MIEKHLNKLTKGCELCFKGKKSVLFITGKCPRNCIYCPLSKEKKNNDIININELKTRKLKEIINEIKLSNSKGIGITGGDPLAVLSRTINTIKALKKEFGKSFHIHLYTSLDLINKNSLIKLQNSGLDELRVHPDIFNKHLWEKIKLIKELNSQKNIKSKFKEFGIEIPVFPNEENKIIELIEFSKNYVDFYNLNQLEYATLYENIYKHKKWIVQEDYSVIGSEETALKIIKKYSKFKLRIHYCSSKFKDSVQFTNRIKIRAKNIAQSFDKITQDGLLKRGVICINEKDNANQIINELKKQKIKYQFEKNKSRILFNQKLAQKLSKIFKNVSIIEEYPTTDGLVVEEEKLS